MIYLLAWIRGAAGLAVALGLIIGFIAATQKAKLTSILAFTIAVIGLWVIATLRDLYPEL